MKIKNKRALRLALLGVFSLHRFSSLTVAVFSFIFTALDVFFGEIDRILLLKRLG